MKKILISLGITFLGFILFFLIFKKQFTNYFFQPQSSKLPTGVTTSQLTNAPENEQKKQIVAENLNIPWEITFLPDSSYLVTQRPGQLVRITNDKQKQVIPIQGVAHQGEGGLMGLALSPEFSSNNWIYLYLTSQNDQNLINRVERYTLNLDNNQLTNRTIIINNIPGANYHDGGRIKFGPDKLLYISTGDAGQTNLAQNINSLAGKILRINQDGSIPSNNPFNNEIYSYGHRNVQGFAWDQNGNMWATEHGPSGLQSGNDEINLIKPGQNYGWPVIKGQQQQKDMVAPIIESGTEETWAPAGMEIIDQKMFFVGLRGSAIYETTIEAQNLNNLTAHFQNEYGRLRFVRLGPDGWLYIGTSNTDGRGNPRENDDRIIKIHSSLFEK